MKEAPNGGLLGVLDVRFTGRGSSVFVGALWPGLRDRAYPLLLLLHLDLAHRITVALLAVFVWYRAGISDEAPIQMR
jgi:hypothetical protein